VSFKLDPSEWEQIRSFQAREIELLASTTEFARCCAMKDHYARIGAWIRPEFGRRVLEIGCGPGRYVALLASLGFDVVGVDCCAAAAFPSWQTIEGYRKVEFRELVFAENLPFATASFDQITCLSALLYFTEPLKALSEIRRVLKPGGRMLVRNVNRRNLYRLATGKNIDPVGSNVYTMKELKALLSEAGFVVHKGFAYGFYPPLFIAKWWHLVNGIISTEAQGTISAITPPPFRVNLVAFCSAS
jgi:SAM-dependent methyltransferase